MAPSHRWWPASNSERPSGVVAVAANYNTRPLIARWLWSLYRFAGSHLRSVVVVDNASTDGSADLLETVAATGVCELIRNQTNVQHGPALSQAISYIATRHDASAPRPWLWLLDSDCVVARHDAVETMLSVAATSGAAVLGEPHWDRWNNEERFLGFSVLLDPARTWRPQIGAIEDGGDPIGEFERSCRARGVSAHPFPFTRDGHVIHLGRGTLAGLFERSEARHPLFEWAKEHHEPHFQAVPGARERYVAIVDQFEREVPDIDAASLIRACTSGTWT